MGNYMIETAPITREDCIRGKRPCPWIRCKYHMVWVSKIDWDKSDDEIVDAILSMNESCVLDMAEEKNLFAQIGRATGFTREWIRRLGKRGLSKIYKNMAELQ